MNKTVSQPRRGSAPVVVLLLLAPIVSELLFGTTRITTIFVLLPQIGTWGCAALLIRELARRRRLSGMAILLLGMALAVAEECIIQQTSLAPLVGTSADHVYGRTIGVNWVYFLWALVYESVWAVVIPIQLAELIFPDRRQEPWLGNRGLILSTLCSCSPRSSPGIPGPRCSCPDSSPSLPTSLLWRRCSSPWARSWGLWRRP